VIEATTGTLSFLHADEIIGWQPVTKTVALLHQRIKVKSASKRQVIKAPGARFASAAFVTGALDRVANRADFLALAARAAVPILLVYGAETPSRSPMTFISSAALRILS
jgi:hypothetical protein